MLKKVGIIKNNETKVYRIFSDYISSNFLEIAKMKSSEYVSHCMGLYQNNCPKQKRSNKTNGDIFEIIIQSELYRQNLIPMFLQANVTFVPNAIFDILYFFQTGKLRIPITLSLKASLRERYKQADLEAFALKHVHRKAQNYLITLDQIRNINKKIDDGELLGLDRAIKADSEEFDELIKKLADAKLIHPDEIEIITAKTVVTVTHK